MIRSVQQRLFLSIALYSSVPFGASFFRNMSIACLSPAALSYIGAWALYDRCIHLARRRHEYGPGRSCLPGDAASAPLETNGRCCRSGFCGRLSACMSLKTQKNEAILCICSRCCNREVIPAFIVEPCIYREAHLKDGKEKRRSVEYAPFVVMVEIVIEMPLSRGNTSSGSGKSEKSLPVLSSGNESNHAEIAM